jgi:molybdopterin/thiamine biosynthesis adenylyltransferase
VVTYDVRLGADNILDIIDGYDVIVDGTDNFPTRYLVNDASLLKRIPVVHGSIFRFEGQATVFDPYVGPVLPLPHPRAPAGRAGPLLLRGRSARRAARHRRFHPGRRGHQDAPRIGDPLEGRLLAYDALEQSFRTFKVHRDPECPACGPNAAPIVIAEYDDLCMPHAVAPGSVA